MPPANQASVLTDLQVENQQLKNRLKVRDGDVTRLTKELRTARASIAKLTTDLNAALSREEKLKMEIEEDELDDEDELPEAIATDIYMCSACTYEVVDGYCQGQECGLQHAWPPAESLRDNYSISTNTHAIHPDRSLVRRGNTPLRDISEHDSLPPEEYRGSRRDEYEELLRRGATRLMCKTFHLEYSKNKGIHAWADWEIYHHFASPDMQKGDFWKIHLGHWIELDEEDLDGSMFIEDLLEDALMYPMRSETCKRTYERWETIEESPGIWLTRLEDHKEDESDHDDVLSGDDSSEHDCSSQILDSDEDEEPESPSKEFTHPRNVYSSGDDMDTESDEISDDDDFASRDSNSDSEDREVYDTAFVGFTGPDGAWDSDMDDSEDEEYAPKAEDDELDLEL